MADNHHDNDAPPAESSTETTGDPTGTDTAEATEATEAVETAAPAGGGAAATMLLFQAPEPIAPTRRASTPAEDDDNDGEDGEDDGPDPDGPDSDDADDDGDGDGDGDDGEGNGAGRRRRRRGGRRRRKSGGGQDGDDRDDADGSSRGGDQNKAGSGRSGGGDAAASKNGGRGKGSAKGSGKGAKAADDDKDDAGGPADGSSSSRRRRRRRREGEGGDNGNDDPNTVTKVRKARSAEDEITAVTGSTRLEAKKQRRREGREAGRRRAPIISEAEFLARREAVERVMVIRQRKDLTQIGVLEDKVLVEHYVARESQTSLIGNVYLGRVQNVLPSMEAAFIDIGKGRNAVLYAGEVNWSALGHKEGTPRKIETVLQSGQTVLVQVTKDPVGHKGARLTSQVSLAGRFLVYVPDGNTSGISRKLPDTERSRLKTLLKEIVPESAGVIVRTAAEGASEEELTRDVQRLTARWEDIEAKVGKGNAPQLLYGEPDLTLKVVRDLFTEDFAKLVVQGDDAWETVSGYVEHVAPDLSERLEHYRTEGEDGESRPDVFATYRIDEQIAKGLDRKVWLPSGGSLIIDRTEAMTVIDVNTGKFTGSGGNLEETVTKNNLEAAEEIVRQLRLRDIGGIIVVDFIDMVLESNRDLVLRRLVECLGRDRTRHQVAEVTSLGLVQMTRKRIGTGLVEAFSESCDHCQGRGLLVHDLPVEPRRGGDEGRRGGRRRRGKGGSGGNGNGGGGQSDSGGGKAVPSPKEVAAMSKPPAPEPADPEPTPETAPDSASETAADAASETASEVAPDSASETAADAAPDAAADAVPHAAEDKPEPGQEASADQSTSGEQAPTTVVTRTRRRSASRPAGPPADGDTSEAPSPEPEPEPEKESNAPTP